MANTMSHTSMWNPTPKSAVFTFKNQKYFNGNKTQVQFNMKNKRNFSVYAIPEVPLPSGPPPTDSNNNWIFGLAIPFIIPFFTSKDGPFGLLKTRIENTLQRVEDVVETVETVAGGIEKAAEDMLDDLPEGKIKDFVNRVERFAETTAKQADTIDDFIDKVQEVQDQAEDMAESFGDEEKKLPEGAKTSTTI